MKKILILLTAAALTLTAQTFNVSTTPELRAALENAAGNGDHDTIILADGTYKTTDDGEGTFIYVDDEPYDLTLIGSNSSNVILSGDKQNQIFNYDTLSDYSYISKLKIEKLTFLDGGYELNSEGYPTNYGGGFKSSNFDIEINDCNFTNNQAIQGGGFYSGYNNKNLLVRNTTFTHNSVYSSYGDSSGGGFYSNTIKTIVTDSNFTYNTAYINSDALGSKGGGFYAKGTNTIVNNSIFIGNSVDGDGGGLYLDGIAEIRNSQFIENKAYSPSSNKHSNVRTTSTGGGISANSAGTGSRLLVENTIFHKNLAEIGAGIYWYKSGRARIIKSIFTENIADNEDDATYATAAAFYVWDTTIVQNSIIKDNYSASHGAIIEAGRITIVNSIISNHDTHPEKSTIIAAKLYMSNSILSHNGSGIRLQGGTTDDPSLIINSIFVDANDSIIITEHYIFDPVVKINNSYLDIDKVEIRKLISNNIYEGVTLGFTDEANEDYHLTAISDLIDAGTNEFADKFIVDGINYLANDYEDNNRSVGANMDIGIYEYTTSKPTITTFTHSEEAKTLQETSFTVEYVLSDGREIREVSFDYLNDGTFSTEETHIFTEAKTYQVTVKITDDTGEFSLRTIAVIVSALPYDEMTDAQRLINATNPLHYEDILSIIEQEKVDAEDAGILEGKVTGEEYVLNNLTEFNLIDKSTVEFTTASLATLPIGWSLVGISLNITDLSVFDDATIVWSYDNSTSSWGAYSSDAEMKRKITDMPGINLLNTIPAGSGVWIEK